MISKKEIVRIANKFLVQTLRGENTGTIFPDCPNGGRCKLHMLTANSSYAIVVIEHTYNQKDCDTYTVHIPLGDANSYVNIYQDHLGYTEELKQ